MFKTSEEIQESFARDVLNGLSRRPKVIPSRWLYDERGSELFEDITQLEEYYPTRTERTILEAHAGDIAAYVGPQSTLVEYGAGAAVKTRILLDALENPNRYVPIDISAEFLNDNAASLQKDFPDIAIEPVVADFLSRINLPAEKNSRQLAGFFPGSTIGNLSDPEIITFFENARRDLGPDAYLILGADLKKDPDILIPAYNDAKGVTAAFNLNLLKRINRELDANVDLDTFEHEARWNEDRSRIEMHLVSNCRQSIEIKGRRFDFAQSETIHTENSRKFQIESLEKLAAGCGWILLDRWLDQNKLFSVLLFRAGDPLGTPEIFDQ